jgi:hypothetical protein
MIGNVWAGYSKPRMLRPRSHRRKYLMSMESATRFSTTLLVREPPHFRLWMQCTMWQASYVTFIVMYLWRAIYWTNLAGKLSKRWWTMFGGHQTLVDCPKMCVSKTIQWNLTFPLAWGEPFVTEGWWMATPSWSVTIHSLGVLAWCRRHDLNHSSYQDSRES